MTPTAYRLLIAPLLVAATLLAALATQVLPAGAANVTIAASGTTAASRFVPNTATVNMGDTVTFNRESGTHSATAVNGAFDVPLNATATTGSWLATAPGTYYFYCKIHAVASQATEANVVANSAQVGKIVVTASATTSQWQAQVSGASEVPANTSTARGAFGATLDEAAGTLAWALNVPQVTNATAAHLHIGAPGVNGPVVVDLFAAPASGPASSISTTGVARVAELKATLAGNFPAFVTALKGGQIYVNVHTTALPAGEIRGQVVPLAAAAAPPAAAPAPAKTGSAGLEAPTGATAAMLGFGALTVVAQAGARQATRRQR